MRIPEVLTMIVELCVKEIRIAKGEKEEAPFDIVPLLNTQSSAMTTPNRRFSPTTSNPTGLPVCECHACSPRSPASRILHSSVDGQAWEAIPASALQPPFVRSYVHHLLHTHEMSSHSLLAMHNLAVLSAFLDGIRAVLGRPGSAKDELTKEIGRFEQTYDEELELWDEAEKMWLEVERARGKGRLAREKEKQAATTIGTAVEL